MGNHKSKRNRGTGLSAFQRIVLNVGAALGSLCLIMTVATMIFGLKPLIFASGSMEPSIPTGSLGIAVPTAIHEINQDEIVSVINSENQRITHRVVENSDAGLVLKGDSNPIPDLEMYHASTVDKLLLSIPVLGYAVSWLSQPWAFFLGGLLCAYLLYIAFVRSTNDRGSDPGNTSEARKNASEMQASVEDATGSAHRWSKRKSIRGIAGLGALLLVSTLIVGTPKIEMTQAAFAGNATSTSSPVAASLPAIPGALTCTTVGGVLGAATSADVSWPAPAMPGGAKYAVRVQFNSGDVRFLNVNAGTTSVRFSAGLSLLGAILGAAQTFEAKVLVVTTTDGAAVTEMGSNIGWSSPVATAPKTTIRYRPGILLINDFSCA
ncbi:signal peptidase I [Arthrobacter sp. MYb224]|uniref:signal peptidase I n=1 Tax=Arthrobacter sp. MYb224 TaxID=1848600 RepID=UPI0015E2A58C|nr:signal peptidase I [Arthrobacter sp. MYb224]